MHRLVFFGVDGPFSTIPLDALARTDLKPSLVVHGLENAHRLRPIVEHLRARPGLLERLVPKSGGGSAGGLAAEAHRRGIDVVRTDDANCAAVRSQIEKAAPVAFVVAGFPHLLSRELIALFPRGGLNVHPGRLPEERGAAPLFWALKAGRDRIGWTIHVVDEGEDSGDVVASGELELERGTDGQQILRRCAEAALPSLIKSLRGLIDGDLVRMPQAEERAGRCPRPQFRDGRIDPGKTAEEVFTFVGGCAASYSVFAECGGDRFFIKRALSYDMGASLAFEYVLTGDRLLLRCAPGIVELELKEEGAIFTATYSE
jgi:methionyl-tRNA formyltransferase